MTDQGFRDKGFVIGPFELMNYGWAESSLSIAYQHYEQRAPTMLNEK